MMAYKNISACGPMTEADRPLPANWMLPATSIPTGWLVPAFIVSDREIPESTKGHGCDQTIFIRETPAKGTDTDAGTANTMMLDAACVTTEHPAEMDSQTQNCELLATFQSEIHRFVASRINGKAEAEDISQEALLRAIQKLDSFRGDNLRAWLFSIARNLIVDRHRAQDHMPFTGIDNDRLQPEDIATHPAADSGHAREHLQRCLDCITTQMPVKEQVAVLLSDVHGYCDKASATRMNMSLPSFKFLLHKARRRLRRSTVDGCPLLSKAGIPKECPGCLHDALERFLSEHRAIPPLRSCDKAFVAVRTELVDALDVGIVPAATHAL